MIWFRYNIIIVLQTLINPLILPYTVIFLKSILFVLYTVLFSISYYCGLFENNNEVLSITNYTYEVSTIKYYMLNWKIPSQEYLYSNFNNMELEQIHKYYNNLESYNNLPKDDGIIKKDFIRHQILKELYYTCTINDTRPHVRFVGKTVYEIIPENYYYSDSDSSNDSSFGY